MSRQSTFLMIFFSTATLSLTLAPPKIDGKGMGRVFQQAAQGIDFFFQQESGHRRQVLRDAGYRGMGTVRGAEGIIDIDITQAGQRFGKVGVAGFFFGVKAQVFQQQDITGF